jgi:hypothetical protein
MVRFLKIFLIFIVLYHIFVTLVWYWLIGWAYPQLPALWRDVIWLLFFVLLATINIKSIKSYLKTWKRPRITLIILIIFGILMSIFKGKEIYDIFVGIKYGLLYLFIFLSATFIGYIWKKKEANSSIFQHFNISIFINFLKYLLIITIIGWFIRQWLKFIRPDIFLHIGYWPLNDFKFWVKPPIYYLTGYKWTPRRQWIFSWPNNYGYFLIAFLPMIVLVYKQKISSIQDFFRGNATAILNGSIIVLWILSIILTLSRTAYIGGIVWLALINIQRIRKHKKISRGIFSILIVGLVGLSILKWASTIDHIKAKFGSLQYVIDQPSWYGLGTSGPAVNYNGTILPENYYIQLMLDIGTLWFLIRSILILQITGIAKTIQQKFKTIQTNTNEQLIYLIRKWLNIGWVALLIMGMFLHVFEDSMINYLFFVSWWILNGYLSTYIKKRD